ncbi:hypothetical protein GGI11_005279 [Coemansia sp. RSA 2049]|nr:hypothetical protein GGI11_005279 [Coemansia sp. RSA 2049]
MDGRTLKAIKHRHWVLAQMKKKNELDGAADRNKRSRRKSVSILPEEKKAIKEAVRIYGEKSWERVAEHVAKAVGITRAAPLVSQIWFYGLCPKTQSAPRWNEERNSRLKALVKEHGRDSVFLSYKFFPEYPPPFLSRLMARLGSKHENSDPRLFRLRSPDALIEKDKKPQGK